jgi:hypothetical protein
MENPEGEGVVPVTEVTVEPPSRRASKAEWVEYAVQMGTPRDEAEAATRDELAERYSGGGGS